jgi:hypothetical protein
MDETRTDVRDPSLIKKRRTMKIMENIPVWGEHEEKTLTQIRTCTRIAPL